MQGDGHHIEPELAVSAGAPAEATAPGVEEHGAPEGDVLARLAAAIERQIEVAEAQLAATRQLEKNVRRQTILAAMGPEVAGHVLQLDAKDVMAVMAIGETKLAELVRKGAIPMRRHAGSSKRWIAASALAAAIRALNKNAV
ncbi:MAG: hypothetical protein AAFQ43_00505 [Bacteroidota bacterium]